MKPQIRSLRSLLAVLAVLAAPAPVLAQDAAAGEQVFRKCVTCHRIGEGAKNNVGPVLTGVVGRKVGTAEAYPYSILNKSAGEAGLVWTEEALERYLQDPNTFLKTFLTEAGKPDRAAGMTKMAFRLPDAQERKDVIAYLKKFSP